jgi:NAD(P)-dependent dehydrogenase (short-subunit alcohol dehydrogenase family)
MSFEGKRALVTGAGSGIGAAVARRLAADGAEVIVADLSPEAVADELGAHPVVLDVREEEQVAPAMADLDVLVNCAGIGSTTNAPETTLDVWENVFAVNARGTFLCCKHAVPGMAARGGGSIVNIASVAALVGLRNRAAYCASKGAVISLTRALAVDHVGEGIPDAVAYLAAAEFVTGSVLVIDGGLTAA